MISYDANAFTTGINRVSMGLPPGPESLMSDRNRKKAVQTDILTLSTVSGDIKTEDTQRTFNLHSTIYGKDASVYPPSTQGELR